MERNKTIKIFIASSDELVNDRNAFGNLVRRLDKIYEQKGIRIELFEWEDYDAAYNDRRKQDEYNDQVRACDMFLALFHIKAGKYTIEEFDVATEEFRRTGKTPKSYVYCRKIEEGEQESDELKDFKKRLLEEMGHYWSNYDNQDSMQLHFVMQLQLVENSGMVEKLKLEDGKILLEGMPIASMNNLRFASNNKDYLKISAELVELPTRIERARQRVEKLPNDKDLLDDLQQKIDYYNSLKKEFNHLQNALFETALRIASIQYEHVSELLRQAIGAFENGNIERANAFLDVIAHEAEQHFAQLDQQRTLVHEDIEAFQLQTKTILANVSLPIDERIERVAAIYAKADNWAEKSALDKEKHAILLSEYFRFLSEFALYDKEEAICHRLLNLCKVVYGDGHPYTAVSYGNLGSVYDDKGDYNKALEYYFKGLSILEKKVGVERVETSVSYSNIGNVYGNMGEYQSALDYYFKALEIQEKLQDDEYLLVATSCGGIGSVYDRLGNYTKALDYYFKALTIIQRRCEEDCSDISILYGNIGGIYDNLCNYSEALEYLFKALAIQNKTLGYYHPFVAISYMKIGAVYYHQADYSNALDCYHKALEVQKRVYGDDHPDISDNYNCIGAVYLDLKDYCKALEYFRKSLFIREKILGLEHDNTAVSYNNIGAVYKSQGDYDKALEFYSKSLDIKLKVFGHDSIATATSFHNVGGIYSAIGDFNKALDYYRKALDIRVSILGTEHPDIADSYNDIGTILLQQGNCSKALEFMLRTLSIYKTVYGIEHPKTALSLFNIGYVYYSIENYTKAIEYYYKSLTIRELILGIDHYDTATSYYNIGLAYFKQGDYHKAMDHFIKAKTIFEKYLDNSHPNIIALQDNIAFVKGLMEL